MSLLYEKESFALRRACFEVYNHLGTGFLEAVYQEALSKELQISGIPYREQPVLQLQYKGIPLIQTYKADFICFDKIILELKAVSKTTPEHEAQIINYMRITGFRLGFLVNFGHFPKLELKRLVL